ncbi:hypothetical protein L7F22_065571 [Adiantum nelumboides]|nr:hypothetical protein [Adiantum nelumboides]
MGESRSAPPIVSSSQIHANVSKKSKQHVAPHLQTTLASRFAPKLKKEAEIAEQQFFYQCNLAFRIARSPAYHRFYNTLVSAAAAGATGLRPVNAEALRTTHLKSQVAHIKKELEGLQACWQRYGCSIISNGWSDIKRRHMINILVSSCAGTTLLRVIDASMPGLSITGEWIYEHIRKAIEEVGPKNMVQVVTDNGSNCASMGRIVEEAYPYIVWTPCAAHSLDLLCEDIAQLPWVLPVLDKAMFIITFITKRPQALALFRNVCQYELVKPAKTRFGYLFLVLQRLVQSKDVLRRLVCSVEWSNWNGSRKSKATAMCDHILSNSFWDDAEAIKQAVSPLYFVLRLFDHEGATMSLVYHYMQRLGTCMTTCNALSRERKDDLVQHWNEHFDWFHKPIHIVAYMLHPLYKKLSHWNDRKLIEAWTRYIETVYATDDCSLLSTSQLDKLVYVNANLRLLERLRLRDGNGEGVLQWKVKDIDASVIANLERGLARGEAIDITFIQQ